MVVAADGAQSQIHSPLTPLFFIRGELTKAPEVYLDIL